MRSALRCRGLGVEQQIEQVTTLPNDNKKEQRQRQDARGLGTQYRCSRLDLILYPDGILLRVGQGEIGKAIGVRRHRSGERASRRVAGRQDAVRDKFLIGSRQRNKTTRRDTKYLLAIPIQGACVCDGETL